MTVEETRMSDMNIYLQETESIDYSNPIITKQINLLKEKSTSNIDYIKNAYEFVRDKIFHSWGCKNKSRFKKCK
ncbi:MAG: hypothetical protein MSC48_06570 [Spirochaetia bacterium]|nr:hypothetical protein [Spirochaetia bacterium]